MNLATATPVLMGDISRFGDLRDRIELLVETQVKHFDPGIDAWLVLPWADNFYLFSESHEGQRRGREVVQAFLGPSIAVAESVNDEHLRHVLPDFWLATGLVKGSRLRRVAPGKAGAHEMLTRLEDLIASLGGRSRSMLQIKPSHSDLLRDFRLALLGRDETAAGSLLAQLKTTGQVSAENYRYLRIEYFAAFGRWSELRSLPQIDTLLKARRPRVVSETLLRMVWWTELAGPEVTDANLAFESKDIDGRYGALLRSVRLPATPEGRRIALLSALHHGDAAWQAQVLEAAETDAERSALGALVVGNAGPKPSTAGGAGGAPVDSVRVAFDDGRFADVIGTFVADPKPEHAELALGALIDSGIVEHRDEVVHLTQMLVAAGDLELTRHGKQDLDELGQTVAASSAGWTDWSRRLAGSERWADAAASVRTQRAAWEPLGSLSAQALEEMCEALMEATAGLNSDQLRLSLDILCEEATLFLAQGQTNDFCQVVLAVLSEQENFSEMVRNAYLGLFSAWLAAGPTAQEYGDVLDQTAQVWKRIASPNAVDWACSALDELADAAAPDVAKCTATAIVMIEGVRHHANRLSLRQQVVVEGLAAEFGLAARDIEDRRDERDIWATLNGKYVGIYSLLTRAELYLRDRLAQLCTVGEVRGNSDKVATQQLKTLAERADYLIVDTWHAAHQATGAIDAIRPKDRQILPKARGHSGFLRALEEHLSE